MTTSHNQRAMHRISPSHSVCRRLFPDESADEARTDNFANVLQESLATDSAQKMLKWNFDFKNEVPLEGDYEWFRCDGPDDWIPIKPGKKIEEPDEQESLLMQTENETTPKSNHEDASAPVIRKRRNNLDHSYTKGEVKRKLSFDKVTFGSQ
uniref:Cyclin-dependent kinase inhibitor domain-containing protein n=2 Tax=Pectinophora gossypiella TaxID=13191 RepID=A0A1E1W5S4_PECGO